MGVAQNPERFADKGRLSRSERWMEEEWAKWTGLGMLGCHYAELLIRLTPSLSIRSIAFCPQIYLLLAPVPYNPTQDIARVHTRKMRE